MASGVSLQVEVAYAEPHRQRVIKLSLPSSATVADALEQALAQWRLDFPPQGGLGIHGEIVERTQALAEGDRVEIYRALPMDPKEARRQRAEQQKSEQSSARK